MFWYFKWSIRPFCRGMISFIFLCGSVYLGLVILSWGTLHYSICKKWCFLHNLVVLWYLSESILKTFQILDYCSRKPFMVSFMYIHSIDASNSLLVVDRCTLRPHSFRLKWIQILGSLTVFSFVYEVEIELC